MKKKGLLGLLFMLLAVVLLVGCTKITASLDGISTENPADISNSQAVPTPQNPAASIIENSDPSQITGNTVADVTVPEHQNYTVKLTSTGFNPDKITIKVGDTITWENDRSGKVNQGMIIGVRECHQVRSEFLKPGQSYSWTFDQAMTCTITDGVMTTRSSKVTVE